MIWVRRFGFFLLVVSLSGFAGFALATHTTGDDATELVEHLDRVPELRMYELAYAFAPSDQVREIILAEPPQPPEWEHTELRVEMLRKLRLAVVAETPSARDALLKEAMTLCGGCRKESLEKLPKHSKAQGSLRRFVGGPFDDDDGFGGIGGWWIFVEVDVQLGPHDIVRPDLAGWRRGRLPDPGDQRPIAVVPDWICEIVSPTSVRRDRVEKRDLYGAHQVLHYWIVDVEARTLEAFERQGARWVLVGNYGDEDVAAIPPFEAIELPVGRLFLPEAKPVDEG